MLILIQIYSLNFVLALMNIASDSSRKFLYHSEQTHAVKVKKLKILLFSLCGLILLGPFGTFGTFVLFLLLVMEILEWSYEDKHKPKNSKLADKLDRLQASKNNGLGTLEARKE